MAAAEITIRTDRGSYVGGDTVYGSVYLCLPKGTPCRCVRLQLRGYEISEYDYQYVEVVDEDTFTARVGQRKAKKDILRTDLKIVESPGGLPEGCYTYPFQYQLPHNLPGAFHCRHEEPDTGRVWEAVIKYSIGAFIDNTEFPLEPRLASETPLVVLDSIECRGECQPDTQTASGSVRTFFCIQRGEVILSSKLDKTVYEPSQSIPVTVSIDNQAAVDVLGATVKLIRVIKLLGTDKARGETELEAHTVLDSVMEACPQGCSKNSTNTCQVTLNLNQFEGQSLAATAPSTSGSLVKCSYVIDVDVHVPWAPDIEVRQPILIMPTSNQVWESWSPPAWVQHCQQIDLTGSLSVPPDILNSQSFSGIPGFQPLI